jgi:hypothetical protein
VRARARVLEASFEVSFDTVVGLFRVSMLGLCVRARARVLEAVDMRGNKCKLT